MANVNTGVKPQVAEWTLLRVKYRDGFEQHGYYKCDSCWTLEGDENDIIEWETVDGGDDE